MCGRLSLTIFLKEETKKVNEGTAIDIVYMDFSKVFKNIPHGRGLGQTEANRTSLDRHSDKLIL